MERSSDRQHDARMSPGTSSDAQPDSQPDAQPDAHPDARPNAQPDAPPDAEPDGRMTRWLTDRRIELCAASLLAAAALATSWSGYQATLWNGRQGRQATLATSLRMCSSRALGIAGQLRIIDVLTFVSWLDARGDGKTALAQFYERRFRPEFAHAFRAWSATRPFENSAAPLGPFSMAEYRLAEDASVTACEDAAEKAATAAQYANGVSDRYMFSTVIFAVVLFFATSARDLKSRDLRIGLLLFGTVACLGGLAYLTRLPASST
jgi:hypothetical protein